MFLQFDDRSESQFTDWAGFLHILQDIFPLMHHNVSLVGAHTSRDVAAVWLVTAHWPRGAAVTGHCHHITQSLTSVLFTSTEK